MRFKLDIVSKYRNPIYGVSIVWIMIFHAAGLDNVDYSFGHESLNFLAEFINVGNIGVDIFLFLSGVCLYFSFHKNPDIYAFIKKRFARLYVPAIVIFIAYWTYQLVVSGDWGSYVLSLSLLAFWFGGDGVIWFVAAILIMYLLYPYIYHFLFDAKHSFVRLLILLAVSYLIIFALAQVAPEFYDRAEIALTRFPVFFIGCWAGKFVYEKREVHPAWFILVVVAAVFAVGYKMSEQIPSIFVMRVDYLVGGISLAFLLGGIFHGLSLLHRKTHKSVLAAFFGFFGAFSLELYLSHMMCNRVYCLIVPGAADGLIGGYYLMLLCSIIIAYVVYRATTPLVRLLSGKKKLPDQTQKAAEAGNGS